MAMYELQVRKALEPTKTWQREVGAQQSAVNTATTYTFDMPKDHFIHEILIQYAIGTTDAGASLSDALVSIQLVANGNKYLKDLTAGMLINIQRVEGQRHVTGIFQLFFSTPHIPEAKPLPAWVFTSLQLKITDSAQGASNYGFVKVTVVESAYKGEDLSDWKVLVEKYLTWKKYGANTLWQEYEHERAYKIFTYLYVQDDNGTVGADKYDKVKVVGRKPEGELTIVGEVRTKTLVAENNARLGENLDAGYFAIEWAQGFPSAEFSVLKSYLNIPTAGTSMGLRVCERYVL